MQAIVESALSFQALQAPSTPRPYLLVTSAYSEAALNQRLADLQQYMEQKPAAARDLSYTLGEKRDHLPHRAFMIANEDRTLEEPILAKPAAAASIIFAFTGQGTRWPGMAKELIHSVESFRKDVRIMDQILKALPSPPDWNIEGLPNVHRLKHQANVLQMNCFIQRLQMGLTRQSCRKLFAPLFRLPW